VTDDDSLGLLDVDCPAVTPRVSADQAALDIVRHVAEELTAASVALGDCASYLKFSGQPHRASLAHQAAQRAHRAAADIAGHA